MKTWFTPDGFVGDDPTSKRNAHWLFIVLLVFALILLAACSHGGGYTPAPLPPSNFTGWSPILGPGSQPCNDFDFPTSNVTGYCYNTNLKPRLGQTIRMTYTISGSGQLVPADANDVPPPTLHLFLWRNGDNITCIGTMQQYRWWSTWTELKTGTYTITAKLTPENWDDCYAQNGSVAPTLFEATLNDLRGVGYTFGGKYFSGHGLKASGQVHFHLDSFTIESLTKKRRRR